MEQRIDFPRVAPEPLRALLDLDRYLYRTGLEAPLIDLIKLRVAQMAGSEHAVDMYTKKLLAEGMQQGRLSALADWEASDAFSRRERTALRWTEAVARAAAAQAPDEAYREAREAFSERELVDLTYVVALATAWTRLTGAFQLQPGAQIAPPGAQPPGVPGVPGARQGAAGAGARQPDTSEHITWTTEEQEIRH